MKKLGWIVWAALLLPGCKKPADEGGKTPVTPDSPAKEEEMKVNPSPAAFDGNKRASTTYQLLVYSFADSDGDGVGDFKGIQSKLDYLDALGVTALWLSPVHPSDSYHGYDVTDYFTVNPAYGTEQDFKELLAAAHAKGISIYLDYVLNHTGKGNPWFGEAVSSESNAYSSYYVLSQNPSADVAAGRIDNYGGASTPGMGNWHSVHGSAAGRYHFKVDMNDRTVTVTETTDASQAPNAANPEMWLWYGSVTEHVGLYTTGEKVYEITIDYASDWGFLVCSSTNWAGGTKYGSENGAAVQLGTPYPLYGNSDNDKVGNLVFEGFSTNYFASFDAGMPDLNYGPYTACENSDAFQATVKSARKWVEMGVDGFRLDAVLWIYQAQIGPNQRFLDQWYKAVNSVYKAAGHNDDIFMVGEAWTGHAVECQYYAGLPSCFEFDYGALLSKTLNEKNASGYVSTVSGYVSDHRAQRADAVTSFFFANHDQARWAEWVGRSAAREKQAAAMLLTGPGKPFVYQGEELGYWGNQGGGDEYVRAPIVWDKAAKDCAKGALNGKVDNNMLTGAISVETQDSDAGSILNVYKTWSRLRNTYPALATGEMTKAGLSGASIAAWYMTAGSQKLLVIHNVADSQKEVTVTDSMAKPIGLLGTGSIKGQTLTLGANSSLVFEL